MWEQHRAKLTEILSRFEGVRVLVVGDLILDEFVWGKVDRISPEAPVPVVEVTRETVRLGGAANVAANLAVMGARPVVVGVVGRDRAGERLRAELEARGIGEDGLVVDDERQTSVKTRIIAHHQQVCRTDRESRVPLSPAAASRICELFEREAPHAAAVALSDYAKGVLSPDLAGRLIARARDLAKFLALDPKQRDFSIYRGASLITPNKKEAAQAAGMPVEDETSLVKAARLLLAQTEAEHLLVTRGEEGMTLLDSEREYRIPTMAREVFDVTGAGDTVIATLTLAVAAGATVFEAALLANCAAGVVVGKLGTAAASVAEIAASLNSDDRPSTSFQSETTHGIKETN